MAHRKYKKRESENKFKTLHGEMVPTKKRRRRRRRRRRDPGVLGVEVWRRLMKETKKNKNQNQKSKSEKIRSK